MVTRLLDANILIALFDSDHVHHPAAYAWFATLGRGETYATCPLVEGALVRWILRLVKRDAARIAREELKKIASDPRHRFWADDLHYADISFKGVMGYRQVTDAYLAALARKHEGRLATLDQGLAALHDDVAELIPT